MFQMLTRQCGVVALAAVGVFVLSLSGIDDGADIYNQLRDQLGVFVEPSVIHSDIEIEGGDL